MHRAHDMSRTVLPTLGVLIAARALGIPAPFLPNSGIRSNLFHDAPGKDRFGFKRGYEG
jgi:hypothetical protein